MKTNPDNKNDAIDLRCPECRAQLKKRRTRTPDKCEMVCGGCGQSFDVCDLETLDELKKAALTMIIPENHKMRGNPNEMP